MRIGEECPYITPCGFCSRRGAPCKEKGNKRKLEAVAGVDVSKATESLEKLSKALKDEHNRNLPLCQ